VLQVFPYSAIKEVLLKRSIWGMDIRVPYVEFFATPVDVKETN
jgi:hypothetical protein